MHFPRVSECTSQDEPPQFVGAGKVHPNNGSGDHQPNDEQQDALKGQSSRAGTQARDVDQNDLVSRPSGREYQEDEEELYEEVPAEIRLRDPKDAGGGPERVNVQGLRALAILPQDLGPEEIAAAAVHTTTIR